MIQVVLRIKVYFIIAIGFFGFCFMSEGQTPLISVQCANPVNDCATLEYCVDIELKSDMANQEIFAMNVRFFYDDDVLEFVDFRDFEGGYGPVAPNPPLVNTSESAGPELFNFAGPAEFINGAIQLVNNGPPPIYLDDTEWTRLFRICFLVEHPEMNLDTFCPSIVWDLEVNPDDGGFLSGDDGVVITVVDPDPDNESLPALENVIQYNWEYIGDGSPPYGQPIEVECIDVNCALPVTWIALQGLNTTSGNLLSWSSFNSEYVSEFGVERSDQSFIWKTIGRTDAFHPMVTNYQYLDENPQTGDNYYRIVGNSTDGQRHFSQIIKLVNDSRKTSTLPVIYPNPFNHSDTELSIDPSPRPGSLIQMYSIMGQLVRSRIVTVGNSKIDASGLDAGLYLVVINDGENHVTRKLVIN